MSNIYTSTMSDNNQEIQSKKRFKLEMLAELVKRLKQAKEQFEQSRSNLYQLKGGLLTFKDLLNEDYDDIAKKIDEIMIEIYRDIETDINLSNSRKVLNSDATRLLRLSLNDTKEIACKIIKEQESIPSTSRLQEAFHEAGFDVNLNSLRTVLQDKELFCFDQERGGWRIVERELQPA